MKHWETAAILIAILSVSAFAVICETTADGSIGAQDTPKVVSVEYDSSVGTDLTIVFDQDLGYYICQYKVQNTNKITKLSGPATSSTNKFSLDTTINDYSYMVQDAYTLTYNFSNSPYLFEIYKITFNSNGTSLKSETVLLSTDCLSSYNIPDGYVWNTKSDKSGSWITDLSSIDFTDYAATLYAFKGGKVGVNIETSTSTVTPGSDAMVVVDVTGNSGISLLEINVEYDNTALTLERAISGEILTMGKPQVKNYPFNISFESSDSVSTVGNLFYMRFAVSSDAGLGQYPIVLTVVTCEDATGKVVPYTITGCAVTIAEKMRGDLNGNKVVDDADAVVMKNALANISTGLGDSEFDLNGDGEVNALDSLLLKKQLFGDTPVSFSDPDEDAVVMTVSDGDGSSTVNDVYAGKTVYLSTESSSVTATTSSGSSVAVTSVSDGRFKLVAPAENFTVKLS